MKQNKPGVIVIDGHVQGLALTRSLGENGIPVYVVDRNKYCIAKYSRYCLKFFNSPDYLSNEFIEFLEELAKTENLKGWLLMPCDDHIVYNLSINKKRLSSTYKITSPEFADLTRIINKRNLLDLSVEENVPIPTTVYPDKENIHHMNFPCIIKGNEGQTFYNKTGKKAFWMEGPEGFEELLSANKINKDEIFIQEYIPFNGSNFTLSFASFCIDGDMKSFWMGEKLRDHPFRFGRATFCVSVFHEDVIDYCKRLLKNLKYTGVSEVEFILDPNDGKFKIIEINPRTWLWVSLPKASGINLPLYTYNYVNGIETKYAEDYRKGVYWINLWTDIIFSGLHILKGKLKIATYFSTLFKPKIFAVLSIKDPLPFIMMGVLIPYLARKR